MNGIFLQTAEAVKLGKHVALCTVVHASGSTPAKPGFKMLVTPEGGSSGTVGGGALEQRVIREAVEALQRGSARLVKFDLDTDFRMACGGEVHVFIDPIEPPAKLFIFGAGHVGKALARLARGMGFHIFLIDPRAEKKELPELEHVTLIPEGYTVAAQKNAFGENSFIVIMTPDHSSDEELLMICIRKPYAYLGMIASSEKAARARQKLNDESDIPETQINEIHMPIGIPFAAHTPDEIAVSILAQLIDVRNTKKGR
ncbi:MAG: XdhC family protein [Bacteroidales bacterium]|nr:XdhC family protein [Bacteroidales bacterium]